MFIYNFAVKIYTFNFEIHKSFIIFADNIAMQLTEKRQTF